VDNATAVFVADLIGVAVFAASGVALTFLIRVTALLRNWSAPIAK
jgi:hypothetical protein